MNKKGKHIGTPQFQPMRRTVKQLARNMVHQREQAHRAKTEKLTADVLAAVKKWTDADRIEGDTNPLEDDQLSAFIEAVGNTLDAKQNLRTAWEALEAHVKGGIWNDE